MEIKRRHKFFAPESKGIALIWDGILQVLDGYFHVLVLQVSKVSLRGHAQALNASQRVGW
jgi:hypothetical protein